MKIDRNVIVDGPDGCGKTNIARGISQRYGLPYFKMKSERENWGANSWREELHFGERRQMQLIDQIGIKMVQDRGYPSELVYSRVFDRETDEEYLKGVDDFYSRQRTLIVIPLMKNYDKARWDHLVPRTKMDELHETYLNFCQYTKCQVVTMYVDELGFDLDRELNFLEERLR